MGVKVIYCGKFEGQIFYVFFDVNGLDYVVLLVLFFEVNGYVVSILGCIEVFVDVFFMCIIFYYEIVLGVLYDYGDLLQWQCLVKDGEVLFE